MTITSITCLVRLAVALALLAVFPACGGPDNGPAPRVVATPTGQATEAQLAALKASAAESRARADQQADLAQRASGAVYGGQNANTHNADGLPKEAVATNLEEAASALPPPTADQKLQREKDNARILAGELAAVKAEKGQAISENLALRASLSATEKRAQDAEAKAVAAEAAAVKERAEAAAKLQAVLDSMTARITAAENEAKNKAMLAQVGMFNEWGAWLTGAGVLALGLAGIFGGIAGLRVVGPIAALAVACGMACFGIAQIVGQPWFKWAVLGIVSLVLGVCAWWVVKKYQQGVLKEAAEEKAAKVTGALKAVVPVMDHAYDEASADVRELLDKTIFSRLSSAMDKEQKATVHEIRATTAQPSTP